MNLAKGNFRFAPLMYLETSLQYIDKMPQSTYKEIIEKYVEMNIAHPFREGNGRSMRIWLDLMLKKELQKVIDWNLVDKEDYLSAMERSPINDLEISHLLSQALTEQIHDRQLFMKGIDVSAMSFHKMLAVAKKLDAINEWGSVVALTYMAAQRTYPFYTDMADIKAMLESIARSFGYHYGVDKKVRINTVSQSPTKTTAGTGIKGFGDFFDYANAIAPLGNASAEDCANYCITLFSDLTKMVTMQNLFHDGGYSTTGVSNIVMEKLGVQD